MKFKEGEAWKKVFGPVFIYLNSFPKEVDPRFLWPQAKNQVCHIIYRYSYAYVRTKELSSRFGCCCFRQRLKKRSGLITSLVQMIFLHLTKEDLLAVDY